MPTKSALEICDEYYDVAYEAGWDAGYKVGCNKTEGGGLAAFLVGALSTCVVIFILGWAL